MIEPPTSSCIIVVVHLPNAEINKKHRFRQRPWHPLDFIDFQEEKRQSGSHLRKITASLECSTLRILIIRFHPAPSFQQLDKSTNILRGNTKMPQLDTERPLRSRFGVLLVSVDLAINRKSSELPPPHGGWWSKCGALVFYIHMQSLILHSFFILINSH